MSRSNTSGVDWHAVRGFYCGCRSYKKVAERFGLTVWTVKSRAKRGKWAAFADGLMVSAKPLPDPLAPVSAWGLEFANPDQRLINRFGDPFIERENRRTGERRIIDFNYHYWAGRFCFENLLVFDPLAKEFYDLEDSRGFWQPINRPSLLMWLSIYLLEQARLFNQPLLETRRSIGRLGEMVMVLKAETAQPDFLRRIGQHTNPRDEAFNSYPVFLRPHV